MLSTPKMSRTRRNATVAYPAPSFAVPSSNPGAQSGWEPFNPSLTGTTPSGSAPALSRVTPIAKNDRCIWAAGDQFTSAINLVVYGEGASGASGFVNARKLDRRNNRALFVLPDSPLNRDFRLAWPVDSAGIGYPLRMNAPEVFTVNADSYGGPALLAGSTCYLGGISLTNDDTTKKSWVYLQPAAGGAGTFATVTARSNALISFVVPSIALAIYEVWVHNGRGGAYGWHKSRFNIQIIQSSDLNRDYSGMTVNLKTYTDIHGGGPGTGASVVTAMNAAVAALAGVGGKIVMEAGIYSVDGPVNFICGGNKPLWLSGSLSGQTTIVPLSGYDQDVDNAYGLFHTNSITNRISDLKLDWTNGLSNPHILRSFLIGSISLVRVVVDAHNLDIGAVFQSSGTADHLIFDDCDFLGGPSGEFHLGFNAVSSVLVRNCRFVLAHEPEAAIGVVFDSLNMLIIDCTVSLRNPGTSDGGGGRLAVFGVGGTGITIFNCTTTNLEVSGNQGRGEQALLNDGTNCLDVQMSTGGTINTVKIAAAGSVNYNGKILVVETGKGIGQFARITDSTVVGGDMVYTVDREFLIATDSISRIGFFRGVIDTAISECSLSGDGNNNGASCGWQAFGMSAGVYAFGNSVSGVRFNYADLAPGFGAVGGTFNTVAIWNFFADNTFTGCRNGVKLQGGGIQSGQEIGGMLSVHRDQVATGNLDSDVYAFTGGDNLTCFDRMMLSDAPYGVRNFLNGAPMGEILLYKSVIDRGTATFSGSEANFLGNASAKITLTQLDPTSGQFTDFEA